MTVFYMKGPGTQQLFFGYVNRHESKTLLGKMYVHALFLTSLQALQYS